MQKIRIGDTFTREYTRYNPLASDPTKPDLASPINLTGLTVKFVIVVGSNKYVYEGAYLTITPLAGKVVVRIPASETAKIKMPVSNDKQSSYLEFADGNGNVFSKFQRTEIVTAKQTV